MNVFSSVTRAVRLSGVLPLMLFTVGTEAAGWSSRPDMPTGRQEIYAASGNGIVFIPGGILIDGVTTSSAFESYDVANNSWSSLAALPEPRHHITPVMVGNQVYAMGGFTGPYPDWQIKSDLFVYDVEKKEWRGGKPLPQPQGEHVAVEVNGKVHVIGGRVSRPGGTSHFDSYVDTKAHSIYDPQSDVWTRAKPAPTARNSAAAASIGDLIYVVGGRKNIVLGDGKQQQHNVGTLEVFDTITGVWTTLEPMPEAMGGNAAAVMGGKLYVFGGEQWVPEQKVSSSTWVYDPKTAGWSKGPDLMTARHGLAAASMNGVIYSIGGCTVVGGGAAVGNLEALE